MKKQLFQTLKIKAGFFALLLTVYITTCALNLSFNNRPNFSGKWIINTEKSSLGNVPIYAAVKQFEIKQSADSIHIVRTNIDVNGAESYTEETLSLNNTPCTQLLSNKRMKKSTITWNPGNNEMLTNSSYSIPNNSDLVDYSITQIWTLNKKDKELFVVLTSPSYTIGAVYDRVK